MIPKFFFCLRIQHDPVRSHRVDFLAAAWNSSPAAGPARKARRATRRSSTSKPVTCDNTLSSSRRRPRPCMWRRRTPHFCRLYYTGEVELGTPTPAERDVPSGAGDRQRPLLGALRVYDCKQCASTANTSSSGVHMQMCSTSPGSPRPRRRHRRGSPAGAYLVWPFGRGNGRLSMRDRPKARRRGCCREIHGTWRARPARCPCLLLESKMESLLEVYFIQNSSN